MPSFNNVTVKPYSDKSFVVVDDGGKHENSLLALGGKKNGSLTDKDTGYRFEGYIFANKWLDKVKAWKASGVSLKYTKSEGSTDFTSSHTTSGDGGTRKILMELEKTKAEVKWLKDVVLQIAEHSGLEIEETTPPPRPPARARLLAD